MQALGKALTNPDLKGSTFVVAGHTDAAGSEAYNQDLSERRADSIKRYLIDKFGIAGADLVTVGYGKSKLKDPEPAAGGSEPPRAGRQHGEQDHRVQVSEVVALRRVLPAREPPFRSRSERRLRVYLTHFPGASRYPLRWKTL